MEIKLNPWEEIGHLEYNGDLSLRNQREPVAKHSLYVPSILLTLSMAHGSRGKSNGAPPNSTKANNQNMVDCNEQSIYIYIYIYSYIHV